jgi:hypothetical protein
MLAAQPFLSTELLIFLVVPSVGFFQGRNRRKALLHVSPKEPPGLLVKPGFLARSLPRRERASLTYRLGVVFALVADSVATSLANM